MLVFENPGLMDLTAATVLGVHVKKTDHPIGQFGTGLKNAVAIVLRLGGRVEVWRGRKLHVFGVAEKTIRGVPHRIVTLDGRSLGFTDQLGKHWAPWMAYRELWSNARDEGGSVRRIESADDLTVETRRTRIVVECAELEKAHEERHKIVLMTEPLVVSPGLEIHAGASEHIYYRGIRVAELPGGKKARYTYNLTGDHVLTEDRTLAYSWMIPTEVARGLVQCTNQAVLHDVLTRPEGVAAALEDGLPFASMKDQKPSPQFMEVAEQLDLLRKLGHSAQSLFNEYRDTLPGYVSPYLVQLSSLEEDTVDRALDLVRAAGLPIESIQLRFKSVLKLGRVQASVRDGMVLDYKLVAAGHVALAGAIVEGLAQMAGGSPTEQLARYVVSRAFAPEKPRATADLPF